MPLATRMLPLLVALAAACGGHASNAIPAQPPHVATAPPGEHPAFCLDLVHPATSADEGPIAFSRWGRDLSRLDYDRAYAAFLGPKAPAPELEALFQEELARELLLLRWLEDTQATADENFRVDARGALRKAAADLALTRLTDGIAIAEADIRARYDARAATYQTPEQVQVRVILVPTQAEARALLQRIESGESFRALATELSKHESRERGGDIPPFARGAFIREFEDLAFTLPPGSLGTVSTSAGTFLLQKAANIAASATPYEDVRAKLREELLEEKRAEMLKEIEAGMR